MIEVGSAAAHAEAADEFLRRHPAGLLYYGRKYRALLVDLLGAEDASLVATEDGHVVGLAPLLALHRDGERVLNALPYYGSNGAPLAQSAAAEADLVAAYNEETHRSGTVAATMICNPFSRIPEGVVHNLTDERIAQFTRLSGEADGASIWSRIDSSARRNVNKARRAGIVVERDHDALGQLYELHRENIAALGGRPKAWSFFAAVGERFVPREEYDVWVARLDGDVVAALLLFYFNGYVEYYTPAVAHEHRPDQPLAAILDEALRDAAQRGFHTWNWGGTWLSQESLHRFKRKWAAEEQRYPYFVQVNDGALLNRPPQELLAAFPDFYVAPFSALKGGASWPALSSSAPAASPNASIST